MEKEEYKEGREVEEGKMTVGGTLDLGVMWRHGEGERGSSGVREYIQMVR